MKSIGWRWLHNKSFKQWWVLSCMSGIFQEHHMHLINKQTFSQPPPSSTFAAHCITSATNNYHLATIVRPHATTTTHSNNDANVAMPYYQPISVRRFDGVCWRQPGTSSRLWRCMSSSQSTSIQVSASYPPLLYSHKKQATSQPTMDEQRRHTTMTNDGKWWRTTDRWARWLPSTSRCHLHHVFSTVAVGHLDQLP